jgi:hypothetical protein
MASGVATTVEPITVVDLHGFTLKIKGCPGSA